MQLQAMGRSGLFRFLPCYKFEDALYPQPTTSLEKKVMKPRLFAAVTALLVLYATTNAQEKAADNSVRETLMNYASAVQSKSTSEAAKYVVTTDAFTIFEGGHVNSGWADYRDNHLEPELKQFKEITYSFSDINIRMAGTIAYATFQTHISVKMESRSFDGKSLATAILVKTTGRWKIQHLHTSRIPKKRAGH